MKNERCRVCGCVSFAPVFDFGNQVIANYFHRKDDPPFPAMSLDLVRCLGCSLVQLDDVIDSNLMYRNYWYQSGINQSMRSHLHDLAVTVMEFVDVGPKDTIIDIGCNDGTFLGFFLTAGRRVGIDPSNVKPTVPCEYINDYFTYESADRVLKGRKAKLVTSIAMFYDLNDPSSFVKDVRRVLADDGLWVVELSYLPIMLGNIAYDSVCHEHVVYYRMETFLETLKGTDFVPVHVEMNQMNGGSFRVFLAPNGRSDGSTEALLKKEADEEYSGCVPYDRFADGIKRSSGNLVNFLEENKGKSIYGYGASTKGQIIMQYCNVVPEQIRAIAERNPLKYGLYTPGTNVRICPEEEMRLARPDFLLVFPWYFIDEFLVREKTIREQGTKIVVPLPKFEIV